MAECLGGLCGNELLELSNALEQGRHGCTKMLKLIMLR